MDDHDDDDYDLLSLLQLNSNYCITIANPRGMSDRAIRNFFNGLLQRQDCHVEEGGPGGARQQDSKKPEEDHGHSSDSQALRPRCRPKVLSVKNTVKCLDM